MSVRVAVTTANVSAGRISRATSSSRIEFSTTRSFSYGENDSARISNRYLPEVTLLNVKQPFSSVCVCSRPELSSRVNEILAPRITAWLGSLNHPETQLG